MPIHDLEAILLDVLKRFPSIRRRVDISWVDLDYVSAADFDENKDHACIIITDGNAYIGIHPKHKRAPRYVIEYLVFHELLHIEFGMGHSRLFSVTEHLWPTYTKANDWLFRNHSDIKGAE